MCSSQQTYTKFVPDMLLQAVGGIKYAGIAILASRLLAFADEEGYARVSIDSLCELFSCSENTIKSYARTLSLLDIWHLKTSFGKGHVAVWVKGSNFDAYMGPQKYQTLRPKVSNFDTNNKDYNKDKESAHTCAKPSSKKIFKKEEFHILNQSNIMTVEFESFWKEFHANPEYDSEKERCAGIFAQMGNLLKEDIIKSLKLYNYRPTRFHLRAKKENPRYFLLDYVPSSLRLAKKGTEVTYQQYVKFYNTDLEYDGWRRIHIPEEQRTIFRKES